MKWFWLAVALGGCVAEVETWHGDVSFTADERQAVEEGAAFTAKHAGQDVPVIVWDGATSGRRIVREEPSRIVCPAPAVACATDKKMWFSPGVANAVIAAHEWGHAFGMRHTAGGLMDPNPDTLEWTDIDADECQLHCL